MEINTRKILLINPPYDLTGVKESVSSSSIVLSLAMIGGVAKKHNIPVDILDLNLYPDWESKLKTYLSRSNPTIVGITFTTPLILIADKIARLCKDNCSNYQPLVVAGGPHATTLPKETLINTSIDALATGEGEIAFENLITSKNIAEAEGWFYKDSLSVKHTGNCTKISDLDSLPFGAYELFEINKYNYPEEASKDNPVCLIETSRGCYAQCIFCNKNIFGHKHRFKSSKRIVDEIEYILSLGFKEIHFADDSFTANIKHAESFCKEVLKRNLKFPWVPRSGIRVDRVNEELLNLMKEAGCYHIPFGIESGDQNVLDYNKKGIKIEQIIKAVELAKKIGFETTGYFMFGLLGETTDSIKKTIELATKLELDHLKFGAAIPLPGTEFFIQLDSKDLILTRDWSKFSYTTNPLEIFKHPTLKSDFFKDLSIHNENILQIANKSLHINS